MNRDLSNDLEEDDDGGSVGLAFGQGIFARSETAESENTAEIMSYLMPAYDLVVQAFLVDDFDAQNDMGVEIIPNSKTGVSFVRIDRNMWNFIEDIATCEHEEMLYKGIVLGELLVGTAHRMIVDRTGHLPHFI